VCAALLGPFSSAWAQKFSACDLNQDGIVNAADVTLAEKMALGEAPCTANVEGPLTCTVITVQRVIDASLGQPCLTGNGHAVTLNWAASVSPNIVGYNICRGTASGGPYTQLNSTHVTATTYIDNSVQAGKTYYYVTTAVDTSGDESGYSNLAIAVIPNP
jgi:hypothetical protein